MDLVSPYSHQYHYDSHNRSARSGWFTITAVAAVLGVSAYWFHSLVTQYGWQGALSYIWEGDPYPNLRERLDQLDSVARKMRKPETLLTTLETALERAHLDSIDAADAAAVVATWQGNVLPNNNTDLRTRLGILSSDWDKLAAQVDGVTSDGSVVLKDAKKQLSQRLVKLMERTDVLIAFYKQGRQDVGGGGGGGSTSGAGTGSSTTTQQQ